MAQSTSGTANSVNVASGSPASDGVSLKGGGAIKSEGGSVAQTHLEYRAGATFATHTTKQASA